MMLEGAENIVDFARLIPWLPAGCVRQHRSLGMHIDLGIRVILNDPTRDEIDLLCCGSKFKFKLSECPVSRASSRWFALSDLIGVPISRTRSDRCSCAIAALTASARSVILQFRTGSIE